MNRLKEQLLKLPRGVGLAVAMLGVLAIMVLIVAVLFVGLGVFFLWTFPVVVVGGLSVLVYAIARDWLFGPS